MLWKLLQKSPIMYSAKSFGMCWIKSVYWASAVRRQLKELCQFPLPPCATKIEQTWQQRRIHKFLKTKNKYRRHQTIMIGFDLLISQFITVTLSSIYFFPISTKSGLAIHCGFLEHWNSQKSVCNINVDLMIGLKKYFENSLRL